MSGALYESMFVVEISSNGAEIFCCRMVPDGKECLVVRLLWGTSTETSEGFLVRLVVNALESDVDMIPELIRRRSTSSFDKGFYQANEALLRQYWCGERIIRIRDAADNMEWVCSSRVRSIGWRSVVSS